MSDEPLGKFDLCEHYAKKSEIGDRRRCQNCQSEVDRKFDENWRDLIYPNGELDVEEMKGDLNDYWFLMAQASRIYCHITGGKLSKTNYFASSVISVADDYWQEQIDRAKVTCDRCGSEMEPTKYDEKTIGWSCRDCNDDWGND